MLQKMRWSLGMAMILSAFGSSLVFAQGMPEGMKDKAMSPSSTSGSAADKAGMSGDKMPMEKAGMDKAGMGMEKTGMPMEKGDMGKAGMGKAGMGMEKTGMPMEKGDMGKAGMGKAGMATKKAKAAPGPIDINTADEGALASLKGIGPMKAKAILAYRKQHGPFKTLDEIAKVPGIGKKTVAGLKDHLTVGKGM